MITKRDHAKGYTPNKGKDKMKGLFWPLLVNVAIWLIFLVILLIRDKNLDNYSGLAYLACAVLQVAANTILANFYLFLNKKKALVFLLSAVLMALIGISTTGLLFGRLKMPERETISPQKIHADSITKAKNMDSVRIGQ